MIKPYLYIIIYKFLNFTKFAIFQKNPHIKKLKIFKKKIKNKFLKKNTIFLYF